MEEIIVLQYVLMGIIIVLGILSIIKAYKDNKEIKQNIEEIEKIKKLNTELEAKIQEELEAIKSLREQATNFLEILEKFEQNKEKLL